MPMSEEAKRRFLTRKRNITIFPDRLDCAVVGPAGPQLARAIACWARLVRDGAESLTFTPAEWEGLAKALAQPYKLDRRFLPDGEPAELISTILADAGNKEMADKVARLGRIQAWAVVVACEFRNNHPILPRGAAWWTPEYRYDYHARREKKTS